jgi:RNA polymerase sigma-70 factor (ECF subfamily)
VSEPLSFESFFDAEARTLFRRLCAITGNAPEAEEIMQDAFLALWERWDRVGTLEDPTGYLYRTAMNAFRKRRRRASLALRRTLALTPDPIPFAEIDEQQDVVAALRELALRQRAALALTDVMDYSSDEAGRVLGVSAGTVRGPASRARANPFIRDRILVVASRQPGPTQAPGLVGFGTLVSQPTGSGCPAAVVFR